jgi:hypothetical protein
MPGLGTGENSADIAYILCIMRLRAKERGREV